MEDRRKNPFDNLDLDGIDDAPKPPRRERHEIDASSTLPSREAVQSAEPRRQMNLSLTVSQYARFEALCEREGKGKAALFRAMMDFWERQPRQAERG